MSDWEEFTSFKHECFKSMLAYETGNTDLTDNLVLLLSDSKLCAEYSTWKVFYDLFIKK